MVIDEAHLRVGNSQTSFPMVSLNIFSVLGFETTFKSHALSSHGFHGYGILICQEGEGVGRVGEVECGVEKGESEVEEGGEQGEGGSKDFSINHNPVCGGIIHRGGSKDGYVSGIVTTLRHS